ncbi:hypothetical protein IFM89_005645 [Coptis chinensis]|uniref:Uncharacterized protein n=1 Tax=Coptis chinensis TaxID=261450 RepID=A0A835IWD0_9MAGN|nr:hypothetical protein IFM89_005645 [Coptis chinensis]
MSFNSALDLRIQAQSREEVSSSILRTHSTTRKEKPSSRKSNFGRSCRAFKIPSVKMFSGNFIVLSEYNIIGFNLPIMIANNIIGFNIARDSVRIRLRHSVSVQRKIRDWRTTIGR